MVDPRCRYIAVLLIFVLAVSGCQRQSPAISRKPAVPPSAVAKPLPVNAPPQLKKMLDGDPYAKFKLPKQAKKVITFLRDAKPKDLKLPIKRDGVFILSMAGSEVFTAYVAGEEGPLFMRMLEKAFGKNITTRTVDTVKKCIVA